MRLTKYQTTAGWQKLGDRGAGDRRCLRRDFQKRHLCRENLKHKRPVEFFAVSEKLPPSATLDRGLTTIESLFLEGRNDQIHL